MAMIGIPENAAVGEIVEVKVLMSHRNGRHPPTA